METEKLMSSIIPPSKEAMDQAKQRWDKIAKPLNSLGKLEHAVIKIAGIQRTHNININKPVICVMCADNGVVAQNVTQVGSDITAVVAENMTHGASTVCVMGKCIGADVVPVDIGIYKDVDIDGLINKKIMYGTNDMSKSPAMTREQAIDAINVGIDMVRDLKQRGYNIIITGEMGIGNTTTSSAVASVMMDKSVDSVTGKGAGLTNSGLKTKINVIKKAIEFNKPDKNDPIDVLSKIGGLDICGMTGLYIGGAIYHVPIVIDGFISGISALVASKIAPSCIDYMIPSHVSAEPAGKMLLQYLGFEPMITCDMCLGEGTGAVAGVGLINMGVAVYNSMSCFDDANIPQYEHLD